jgi:hypothetical protein
MSLDTPPSNKMMTAAPAKKEYHFAATAEHYAEVVYAETTKAAELIYHKVKRSIAAPAETDPAPLSTPVPAPKEEDVQS